jgi:rhamnulokinase
VWEKEGVSLSYDDIVGLAKQTAPFQCYINPDHSMFLNPTHMPEQIQTYCRETAQYVPETKGEIIRCILESLALTYRMVFERTEILAKKSFPEFHIVGGGIENVLLCQFTANAIGKPVLAGPTEASTLGNILSQYMALGQIKDVHEARSIIRKSFSTIIYVPKNVDAWNEAYMNFKSIINHSFSKNIVF